MKPLIRFIFKLNLVLFIVFLFSCQQKEVQSTKPNIILIFADDLGYSDLGFRSKEKLITPNLDKLKDEGIYLTDFVVTCPACTPSRSGLLTGRYPQRNGLYDLIRNNEVNYKHRFEELEYDISPEATLGMDEREITIAEVLQESGYKTGMVGKWDGGRAHRFLPLQRGFDFFYGFCNTGIDYWTHERYGVPSMFRNNQPIKEEGYATDLFKREALNFIEQNKNEPFFLYASFNAPHVASNLDNDPFQAPDDYIALYGELPGDNKIRYKAMITCMDAAIGEMLDKLKLLGLENNTLVIFTSDNGASPIGDNSPLRGSKAYMYEGGIRLPFLAKYPDVIPKGVESDEFCSTLDIFPTLLNIAGGEKPDNLILDGYDILSVLKGEAASLREEHFWQWRGKRAVRSGNWKWVLETESYWAKPKDETGELFDLSTDISESKNLASENPEKLKELQDKWKTWRKEMDEAEPRGPFMNY